MDTTYYWMCFTDSIDHVWPHSMGVTLCDQSERSLMSELMCNINSVFPKKKKERKEIDSKIYEPLKKTAYLGD